MASFMKVCLPQHRSNKKNNKICVKLNKSKASIQVSLSDLTD